MIFKILIIAASENRRKIIQIFAPDFTKFSQFNSSVGLSIDTIDLGHNNYLQFFSALEQTRLNSAYTAGAICIIYYPNNPDLPQIQSFPQNIPLHIVGPEGIEGQYVNILRNWLVGLIQLEQDKESETPISALDYTTQKNRLTNLKNAQIFGLKLPFQLKHLEEKERESRHVLEWEALSIRASKLHQAVQFESVYNQALSVFQQAYTDYMITLQEMNQMPDRQRMIVQGRAQKVRMEIIEAEKKEIIEMLRNFTTQAADVMLQMQQSVLIKAIQDTETIYKKHQEDTITFAFSMSKGQQPKFPLSLYQRPIAQSYTDTEHSFELPLLKPDQIRELLIRTANVSGTGLPGLIEVLQDAHIHLTVLRPIVPNNIISAQNRFVETQWNSEFDRFRLTQLNATKKDAIRKKSWDPNSPFVFWRKFISKLTAEHLTTNRGEAPIDDWKSDLIPISQTDPICPLPIYKSKSTDDYWVFGWHGTAASENLSRVGFQIKYSQEGRFGEGFYTAIESTKAISYIKNFQSGDGAFFICASNLGKNPIIFTQTIGYRELLAGISFNEDWERTQALVQNPRIVIPSSSDQIQYEFITGIPPTLLYQINVSVQLPHPASYNAIAREMHGLRHGDILFERADSVLHPRYPLDRATLIGHAAQKISDPFTLSNKLLNVTHAVMFYNWQNSTTPDESVSLQGVYPGEERAHLLHVTVRGLTLSYFNRVPGDKNRSYLILRCRDRQLANMAAIIAKEIYSATLNAPSQCHACAKFTYASGQNLSVASKTIMVTLGTLVSAISVLLYIFYFISIMRKTDNEASKTETGIEMIQSGFPNPSMIGLFIVGFITRQFWQPRLQKSKDLNMSELFNQFFDPSGNLKISHKGIEISETCTSFIVLCYQLAYMHLVKSKKRPALDYKFPTRIGSPLTIISQLLETGLFDLIGETSGIPQKPSVS